MPIFYLYIRINKHKTMCPKGIYDRKKIVFNREKKTRYKVIGFIDGNTGEYFYYGVTRNYTTQFKHYYIWLAKKHYPHNHKNLLLNKILELNCSFEAKEIELLPKTFDFKEAKLYLQDHYLNNKSYGIVNCQDYCFCPHEKKGNQYVDEDVKKDVVDLYQQGYTSKEIAQMFEITPTYVRTILRYKKFNKKNLIKTAIEDMIKNKLTLFEIQDKYSLSDYSINKIKGEVYKTIIKTTTKTTI